jgi:hypothetical protein
VFLVDFAEKFFQLYIKSLVGEVTGQIVEALDEPIP